MVKRSLLLNRPGRREQRNGPLQRITHGDRWRLKPNDEKRSVGQAWHFHRTVNRTKSLVIDR
jgi:hypothetical protein